MLSQCSTTSVRLLTVCHILCSSDNCLTIISTQTVLNLIESYLRTQKVNVEGKTSNHMTFGIGAPQGSITGPVIFLIYSNSLPEISIDEHTYQQKVNH
nr:unnamed protein product [Callosobruchus chinensis]